MNDLISKSKFITQLIHCKDLSLKNFEIVEKFLQDYPADLDMSEITNQIYNKSVFSPNSYNYYEQYIKLNDLFEILDRRIT